MTMPWRLPLTCSDPDVCAFAGLKPPDPGYLPDVCCTSCHQDFEHGLGEPVEVELPTGRIAEVCCAIFTRIPEDKIKYG